MAQQLQNITVAAPGFFGLNTQDSPIGLNPSYASVADNCVIDQYGRVGARKGFTPVSTNGASLLGSSRGIETVFESIDTSGDKVVFSAGNNKIFSGTTTLTDITPVGYNPTANNWKIVELANHVYFFQRDHENLIYTDESGTGVLNTHSGHAHSTGTPPQANEVLSAYGRLWAADITGNKHTVYWSDTLLGHHWNGGTSGSLDLTTVWPTGNDEIVALAAHNGFLIIFGKKSIVVYSGAASPATMVLSDTIEGVGCIARDSVQHTGTDVLFLSDSGVRSFGRIIQEKSLPMRDVSKNVRNDLIKAVAAQTNPIKSVYSAEEAFYLLSFSESGVTYCFDMRGPLDESGAYRATTWSSIDPLAMARLADGSLYFGRPDGIVKYSGNLDGTSSYELRYFSNPLDFGNATNLKFLKKFNLTIIGSSFTDVTLNWGYDYSAAYTKQAFVFSDGVTEPAEYGISEYNTTAEYSVGVNIETPKVNASGSGSVVSIGIEAQIYDSPFSIQKIDIHALLGRLI